MRGLWTQTKREKLGTIDGLNLFFGALLGANLGTLDALPIGEYARLIVLLAGAVVTIRLVATSDRRWYAFTGLALYGGLLTAMLFAPERRPDGLPEADLHRLLVTLAIWIGAALLFEFWPTSDKQNAGNDAARSGSSR